MKMIIAVIKPSRLDAVLDAVTEAGATGLTVTVQTSSDLVNWQTVTPDSTQTIGTDPTTGDPIIQLAVNVTGSTRKFIQLVVTSQ